MYAGVSDFLLGMLVFGNEKRVFGSFAIDPINGSLSNMFCVKLRIIGRKRKEK